MASPWRPAASCCAASAISDVAMECDIWRKLMGDRCRWQCARGLPSPRNWLIRYVAFRPLIPVTQAAARTARGGPMSRSLPIVICALIAFTPRFSSMFSEGLLVSIKTSYVSFRHGHP
jgi:hypothetical protein